MASHNSQASEMHPPGINTHPGATSIFHSTTSSSSQLGQPMSKLVTVKLDDENFLTWKQQILFAIRGYGLEDYITKDVTVVPSQFITAESGTQVHNPEFVAHQRQDQLLTSWLLSSISTNILPHLVGFNTAKEVWEAVNQLFAAQSTARVMNFKLQLQTLKKGNLSMKDYLLKMKSICDNLAACGRPISKEDQVLSILAGLGGEFEPTVAVITSRIDTYSVQSASALLLTSENRTLQQLIIPDSPMQANLSFQSKKHWHYNSESQHKTNRGQHHFGRNRNRGRFSYNKIVCQLCGRSGHTVHKCYHRFDPSFSGTTNVNHPGQSSDYNRSTTTSSPNTMQALLTTPPTFVEDTCWFPDSGATNHVTNDLNQLSINSEYTGPEKIHVGNGMGLPITHVGSASLHVNSRVFHLKNLLHVPSITKNLLSVSQFCTDNNVYFEFNSTSCFVKDQRTKKVLLQGAVEGGLYKFTSLQSPLCNKTSKLNSPHEEPKKAQSVEQSPLYQSFTSSLTNLQTWHARLGHPSLKVVIRALSSCNIPYTSTHSISTLCHACQLGKSHKLPFIPSTTIY